MSVLGRKRFVSLPPGRSAPLSIDVIVAGEGVFFFRDILERLERRIAPREVSEGYFNAHRG